MTNFLHLKIITNQAIKESFLLFTNFQDNLTEKIKTKLILKLMKKIINQIKLLKTNIEKTNNLTMTVLRAQITKKDPIVKVDSSKK